MVADDQRPVSPVTPEPRSQPQIHETPEQARRMTTEASGSGGQDIMQALLQELITQRGRNDRSSQPKIEDPELYYGDRVKLQAFLVQCELKFNCEAHRFQNDSGKVHYTNSRCRGAVWKWTQPSIMEGRSSFTTWEEFKMAIHRAFGEIDAKEVAKVKFNKIEQGARSTAILGGIPEYRCRPLLQRLRLYRQVQCGIARTNPDPVGHAAHETHNNH